MPGIKFWNCPARRSTHSAILFGPTTNTGVTVSTRIFGSGKGRQNLSSFGVGLNGPSGYKLKVSVAKNAVEIFKGDESAANIPFTWKSSAWTMFKFRVRTVSGELWKIEGKVWPQTESEPAEWTISSRRKNRSAPRPPLALGRSLLRHPNPLRRSFIDSGLKRQCNFTQAATRNGSSKPIASGPETPLTRKEMDVIRARVLRKRKRVKSKSRLPFVKTTA